MAPRAGIREESAGGRARTRFHEGELAVQRRAGVARVAAKVGRNILPFVASAYREFLSRQPFAVVARRDGAGRVWASPLIGGVGFASALDDRQVLLAGEPTPGDPLEEALARSRARIGVLAIEFDSRLRIRLNGMAKQTVEGVLLKVAEAFGNCPKFIQRRLPSAAVPRQGTPVHRATEALDAGQAALARQADTFSSQAHTRSVGRTRRVAAAGQALSRSRRTGACSDSPTTAATACLRRWAPWPSTRAPACCSSTGTPGPRFS
jgi:predicted pyridoxine 5'-phosphate oxidase superfamily flavin-nucleotide-binding protein